MKQTLVFLSALFLGGCNPEYLTNCNNEFLDCPQWVMVSKDQPQNLDLVFDPGFVLSFTEDPPEPNYYLFNVGGHIDRFEYVPTDKGVFNFVRGCKNRGVFWGLSAQRCDDFAFVKIWTIDQSNVVKQSNFTFQKLNLKTAED
jgi:hypothetical protein